MPQLPERSCAPSLYQRDLNSSNRILSLADMEASSRPLTSPLMRRKGGYKPRSRQAVPNYLGTLQPSSAPIAV